MIKDKVSLHVLARALILAGILCCLAPQKAAAYVTGDSIPLDEVGDKVDLLRLGFWHWSGASGDPTGDTYEGIADVDDSVGDHNCIFTTPPYSAWDPIAEDYGESHYPFTLDPNNVMSFEMTAPAAGQYVVALQGLFNSAGHYFLEYQKDGNWIALPEFGSSGDLYETIVFCFVIDTGAAQTQIPMKIYGTGYKMGLSGFMLAKLKEDPFADSNTFGFSHGNAMFDANEANVIWARFNASSFLYNRYLGVKSEGNASSQLSSGYFNSLNGGRVVSYRGKLLINTLLSAIDGDTTRRTQAIQLLEKPVGWVDFDTVGHLHQGELIRDMSIAYDHLYAYLTPTQRDNIRRKLDREARILYVQSITQNWWSVDTRSNNWQAVVNSGLAAAGLILREESRYAPDYGDWGKHLCKVYVDTALTESGSCREAYGYYNYALGSLHPFFVMLKNITAEDLFDYDSGVVQKTVPYSVYLLSPLLDGFFNFDDMDYGYSHNAIDPIACIAFQKNDAMAQWLVRKFAGEDSNRTSWPGWRPTARLYAQLWYDPNRPTEDPDTSARTPLAQSFIEDGPLNGGRWGSGHVAMRTGFTSKDDIAFILQCGDSGGYHGHADQSSFLLMAYGGQLVSHVGKYGSYSGAGNAWAHSSKGNSVILIDGKGQVEDHKFGNGRMKRDGTVDDFYHDPNIADYARANSKPAYDDGNNPVDHALRHVLFVRKPSRRGYFVIADDFQSSTPGNHDYSSLIHSAQWHTAQLGGTGEFRIIPASIQYGGRGHKYEGREASLQVMFATPQNPNMVVISSEAGTSFPPYVKSTYTAERGVFVALLYPESSRLGISTPTVTRIDDGNVAGFEIEDDLILFSRNSGSWTYGDVQTDARMLYLDRSVPGKVSYLVAQATTLEVLSTNVFESNEPVTTSGTYILDPDPPTILAWYSAGVHGRGVGEALLEISDDGEFSEPRSSGINKLVLTFDEPIDPTSLIPANVEIAGLDANNTAVDLGGIVVTTSTTGGDTIGEINFSGPLPNFARYAVRISGVTDVAGNPLAGDADRIVTALIGDTSDDRRVNSTDLSQVRASRTKLIDPDMDNQVRSDVSVDGRINATDRSRVRAERPKNARGIAEPEI